MSLPKVICLNWSKAVIPHHLQVIIIIEKLIEKLFLQVIIITETTKGHNNGKAAIEGWSSATIMWIIRNSDRLAEWPEFASRHRPRHQAKLNSQKTPTKGYHKSRGDRGCSRPSTISGVSPKSWWFRGFCSTFGSRWEMRPSYLGRWGWKLIMGVANL